VNNCRISGRVAQVDCQPAFLQFLLQFRTNKDCHVLVRVCAPLVREKLQDFKPGWQVRVIGLLKSENDRLYVEAFSVVPEDHQKFMQEQRHKFLSGVQP